MATLFNGSLTIQGIFDSTNTSGKADTTSDTIFSVLNNVSYSSNQRVMMEIGASNTNVGNYNSFYKYSLGYSNTANGPGGSFVIQGCPISTNTYNGVNPPRTLMAMNEKSAQIVPSVVLGNNSLGPIYVATYAGTGVPGNTNGPAVSASFTSPLGVCIDTSGNMFVSEYGNNCIRKITPDGIVTTLAGSGSVGSANGIGTNASFNRPIDVKADNSGNVFVTDRDNNRIRRVNTVTGVVDTFSGVDAGFVDGIQGARFNWPHGLSFDTSGNLFVADSYNHSIRQINLNTGLVTTLAGTSSAGFVNAIGSSARFNLPYGLVADTSGNVFVADSVNHLVRKINIGSRMVTTLAGNGGNAGYADGIGANPSFSFPWGLTTDNNGNIFVVNGAIRKITPDGNVKTIVGRIITNPFFLDGNSSDACFSGPSDIALDNSGNMFVADLHSNCIRKVDSNGVVTTLAGNRLAGRADGTGTGNPPSFNYPFGVAVDTSGNMFIADSGNNVIRKMTPDGVVTTLAGSGNSGFADGTGINASFYGLHDLAIDTSGNLFVVDQLNNRIRKIVISTGVVTTIAGNGVSGYADGAGTSASFKYPGGIAIDRNGNLFIADSDNHRIRRIIISTGVVSTLAGSGSSGSTNGTGTSATFWVPYGMAVDISGNLFVADSWNHIIRKITFPNGLIPNGGVVSTLAGNVVGGFADGSATVARFTYPYAVAVDTAGNVYVADKQNGRIRKVTSAGVVSTIAGNGQQSWADGVGSNTSFYFPSRLALYTDGNLIVTDWFNNKIRKVTLDGVVTTLAGNVRGFADGVSTGTVSPLGASFYGPRGIVIDTSGNLFVGDSANHLIRKIVISTGVVTTIAGSGNIAFADGIGAAASFNYPTKLAIDTSGNLFVTDSNNHRIRRIVISTGAVSTVAGSGNAAFTDGTGAGASFNTPYDVDIDENGILYVAELLNHRIRRIVSSTGVVTTLAGGNGTTPGVGGGRWLDGTGTGAAFNQPIAVSLDKRGNLIVSDHANHRIRKIALGTSVVTTIAGQDTPGYNDGLSPGASFYVPAALTLDTSGNLYVTDRDNHRIRKIVISTGVVTTVAGTGQFTPLKNTIGVSSTFYYPFYLAIDRSGNIFVADQINNVIRKLYNYDVGNFSLYTSGDVFTDSSLYAKNIVATNSMEIAGNLTIGGQTTFKTDRWNGSSDGALRLYFGNNSSTYYQTRDMHVFRHASNSGPPYGERDVFKIDGNWAGQGSLALSCAAGNRGTFTHYYSQSTSYGVSQDSYELWWYPGQGQGGLGGSGTTNQVWNLNAAQNYWNVNIPMNLGRDLRAGANVTCVGNMSVGGNLTTNNLTVNGTLNANIGVLTTTDIIQLQAMLRMQMYNSMSKPIFLCTPQYPVIALDGWMHSEGIACWMLREESNSWIGAPEQGGKNLVVSDNNDEGALRTSGGGFDNWDFFVIYPGYGIHLWSYINFTNNHNSYGNNPLTFRNTSNKIMWWRISNPDLGSTDGNLLYYGISLISKGAPTPYADFINSQSSYIVFKI